MDYRYKQLEQELTALSKVFSDLGVRLSEVAKEVSSPGVMPSEKLLEQISASRASFENCRTAIHGHAGAMLVSPLPKTGELVSIAAIESLLKASAVAEENKFSVEAERTQALAILGRVLAITHRETTEFKPLQDCHARLGELRGAITNVLWPHRHPESESVVAGRHPANALLHFVENLDSLEDEKWMALETTITESYGKPLFVAASRGKLAAGGGAKAEPQPAASKAPVAAPAPAKAQVAVAAPPEPPKPAVAAEKPVEKKIVVEKVPEKPAAPAPAAPAAPSAAPAVAVEKKVVTSPVPVAPAAAAPVQPAPKPAAPPAVTPAAPVVSVEKKEVVEKPQPVAAPVASAPAVPATPAPVQIPVVSAPAAPQAVASVVPAPPVVASTPAPVAAPAAPVAAVPAAPAPPRPPAPAPVAAQPAPVPVAATPAHAENRTPVPVPAPHAQPAANHSQTASPAQPQHVAGLSALANATESTEKRPGAPAEVIIDRQRKEPRLASPAPQPVAKSEPNGEEFSAEEAEKAAAGDASQRPQRWGFWRGNRT